MAASNISDKIPHRPPFLWVDRIVSESESTIITEKLINTDLPLFAGHYPDYPILPGVILCEAAFQSGALLMANILASEISATSSIPVVTRIVNAKFKREVRPGETIKIEVKLQEKVGPAWFMRGKVRVHDKVALSLDFSCTLK